MKISTQSCDVLIRILHTYFMKHNFVSVPRNRNYSLMSDMLDLLTGALERFLHQSMTHCDKLWILYTLDTCDHTVLTHV